MCGLYTNPHYVFSTKHMSVYSKHTWWFAFYMIKARGLKFSTPQFKSVKWLIIKITANHLEHHALSTFFTYLLRSHIYTIERPSSLCNIKRPGLQGSRAVSCIIGKLGAKSNGRQGVKISFCVLWFCIFVRDVCANYIIFDFLFLVCSVLAKFVDFTWLGNFVPSELLGKSVQSKLLGIFVEYKLLGKFV